MHAYKPITYVGFHSSTLVAPGTSNTIHTGHTSHRNQSITSKPIHHQSTRKQIKNAKRLSQKTD